MRLFLDKITDIYYNFVRYITIVILKKPLHSELNIENNYTPIVISPKILGHGKCHFKVMRSNLILIFLFLLLLFRFSPSERNL